MIAVYATVIVGVLAVGAVFVVTELRLRGQGYRWKRPPTTSQPAVPWETESPRRPSPEAASPWDTGPRPGEAPPSLTMRGGARVAGANASIPLVELYLDSQRAHIQGPLLPEVWIDRAKVTNVRRVRAVVGSGIRFESPSGEYDGVVFWTFDFRGVLSAFALYGWPVQTAA